MNGFMFPGQGAQSPQMLLPIRSYEVDLSSIFQTVSEGCGFDVEKLIETSTQEILSKTQYTQIVMFATDIAYLEILKKFGAKPDWVAGHSLGQYAAFVAAEVIDLYEAAKLLAVRSRLMTQVKRQGKLCAVSSPTLSIDFVQILCKSIEDETSQYLRIALYNSNRQIVVGGEPKAVDEFAEKLTETTSYKVNVLPVGQAFHTPIMDEMLDEYKVHIERLNIQKPSLPIILNCTGKLLESEDYKEAISREMLMQCNQPVQWVKTMQTMSSMGTKRAIEVGAGHSLSGLLKNMTKEITTYQMDDRKSAMKVLKELGIENM